MPAKGKGETAPMNQTTLELKGDREILITRTFNGPAHIVFEAWTRPEFVRRWWAPKSHKVSVVSCDAEVQVGGRYRYVLRLESGNEFAFSGRYIEVTPPSRLVYTEIFEPAAAGANPGDPEVIVTVTFDESDGRTHMTSHSLCPTKEVRDAIIESGMEHGMRETMEQLEELIATLVQEQR